MSASRLDLAPSCPGKQYAASSVQSRIKYKTSPAIEKVISQIGRTEDIKLSPDNKRLCVVDYLENRLFLFSLRLDLDTHTPIVTITGCYVVTSPSLRHPHGVTFLGNEYIVVCNRQTDVTIFALPPERSGVAACPVKPVKTIKGRSSLLGKVSTPGSVDGYKIQKDQYRILVCNNSWHFITSHIVTTAPSLKIKSEGMLLERDIRIPDGICISPDHRHIAISNHVDGEVLVFRNSPELNRDSACTARLIDMICPHGVRFTPSGSQILVVDASSKYLHVYDKNSGWEGTRFPSKSICMVDEEEFYLGRYDMREGGLKGLDIDNSGRLLVTTRRYDVLGFYDLGKLMFASDAVDYDEIIELRQQRDFSLAKRKSRILSQSWNFRGRIRHFFTLLRQKKKKLRKHSYARKKTMYLTWKNFWSRESILDPSGPVISMTTYGFRTNLVFCAIESIALGQIKPSRLVLWMQDGHAYKNLPKSLLRLKKRGLEISIAEEFGPHTKYYPFVENEESFDLPLVTADDDVLYPRDWLKALFDAHKADPTVIHCHRAHRMGLNNKRFLPYKEWQKCQTTTPSHLNFVTGVSGAIYPPKFLEHLKQESRKFWDCCPTSDDIWITANALRSGFRIAQIRNIPGQFPATPGSQEKKLGTSNVLAGGNQAQLSRTFRKNEIDCLYNYQLTERDVINPQEKSTVR